MLNHKYIKEHSLNFVTYHYVRPVKKSLQPNLAALEFDEFKRQVDYFCNNLFCTYTLCDLKLRLHVLQNPYFVLEVETFLSVLSGAGCDGLVVSDRILLGPKVG